MMKTPAVYRWRTTVHAGNGPEKTRTGAPDVPCSPLRPIFTPFPLSHRLPLKFHSTSYASASRVCKDHLPTPNHHSSLLCLGTLSPPVPICLRAFLGPVIILVGSSEAVQSSHRSVPLLHLEPPFALLFCLLDSLLLPLSVHHDSASDLTRVRSGPRFRHCCSFRHANRLSPHPCRPSSVSVHPYPSRNPRLIAAYLGLHHSSHILIV
jgi:hypothetical protein